METKSPLKTIRFDVVVRDSGRPEPHTLWMEPKDDKEFMRAAKANRVMTLIQPNVGTKKDFGIVGFAQRSGASYLIFPKRIAAPVDTKVVGIKYDRLEDPVSGRPPAKAESRKKRPEKRTKKVGRKTTKTRLRSSNKVTTKRARRSR